MRCAFLLLLLFAVFAFLPLVAGQMEPKLVGSAVVSITLNWNVGLNAQNPQSASFTSFSFLNTSTQTVQFTASKQFTESTDAYGNKLLTFEVDPTQSNQRVSIAALVNSRPEGGFDPITGDLSVYLQPSEYVAITPQIAAKAKEIIGDEQNPLRKAALLTSWVHNNVQYDLSYQDQILTSQQVFEIRRGVCNEYSHLLIAMLRSVDVPARFAAGFVYSGEIWAAHAWVDVGVNGKWYPFDATYNEGILLDATHIKFANGVDQANVTEQFSARGNVDLSQVSLTRSHDVSIVSNGSFSKAPTLEIFLTNQTVQANSIQNVTVSIRSTYPDVVTYPLSIEVPQEVRITSEKTQLLMFFPGEKKFITWTLLVPSNLQSGYIYTYPVIARSLGAKVQGNLQAQTGQAQAIPLIQVTEIRLQGENLIVSLRNTGNTPFVNAQAEVEFPFFTGQKSFSIDPGASASLEFRLSNLNLSSKLRGNITIEAANYSASQAFLLEPPSNSEPSRPAFNVPASKSINTSQQATEDYYAYLPYAAAAIVLIAFTAIIFVKVRS